MLSGRDALPAGRPLERASPWKLQPTAMVRVSTQLFGCKLARAAPPREAASALATVLECLSLWREPEARCSLQLRRLDTCRTRCLEA